MPLPHLYQNSNNFTGRNMTLIYNSQTNDTRCPQNDFLSIQMTAFPGSPMVKILGFHCHGQGSIPGQGLRSQKLCSNQTTNDFRKGLLLHVPLHAFKPSLISSFHSCAWPLNLQPPPIFFFKGEDFSLTTSIF